MATLCSYELSQCSSLNQNKEFIYVKLTDSALRAIEDYQRNQNKLGTPLIQFLGNEGILSFPSATNGCDQKFNFQIQEIDLQGPQGSFECVQQQNSQKQLSTLGTLPYKMRIRANDDVYESTKSKMAKETENSKNKCTREIKPNQTDIGRKVKLKPGMGRYNNIPNNSSIHQKRDPYSSSSSSLSNSNNHSNSNNISSSSSSISNGSSLAATTTSSALSNGNHVPTAAPAAATNNLSSNLNNVTNHNHNSHHPTNYSSTSLHATGSTAAATTLSSSSSLANHSNSSSNSLLLSSNVTAAAAAAAAAAATAAGVTTTTGSASLALSSAAAAATTNNNNKSSLTTNQHYQQQQQQNHSSTLSSSSLVTSNSNHNNHHPQQQHHHLNSSSSLGNSLVPARHHSTTSSATNQHTSNRNQNKRNSEIMKRNIRERLIHLLALRPYKKPELYAKINNDGIKEKEKNSIAIVLKQISFMRDNTYHLHRHIWNDVQEDWPFYSEQDKQTLKRRKPQNLTPPLSSDGGSSTSGQSPTSTHNGSPPPAVKRPPLKSDSSHLDGPNPKKQRISHYKKELVNHDNIRRGFRDSRDASNMNPRSREINHEEHMRARYYGSNVTPNAQESEDIGLGLSFSVLGQDVANRISVDGPLVDHHSPHMHHQDRHDHDSEQDYIEAEINEYRDDANRIDESLANRIDDFSDFTRITSVEQRRQYKTEFDNDYQEYRQLHTVIAQVSNKFARLERDLRNEEHNDRRYREIQKQILKEYQDSNSRAFQDQKQRFNYLHQKLSHIKRLVHEFDTSLMNRPQETY